MATYIVSLRTSLFTDYLVDAESSEAAEDKALYGWGEKLRETWGDETEVVSIELDEEEQ